VVRGNAKKKYRNQRRENPSIQLPIPITAVMAATNSSAMMINIMHPKESHPIKKADAANHPEVIDRVGLLVNEPPAVASCSLFSHPTFGCPAY
jgi:hypothetical protein